MCDVEFGASDSGGFVKFVTEQETRLWAGRTRTAGFDEPMSKRRRGFPSETRVRLGDRVVNVDKELSEKLGRRDLCPCDSGRRFAACCMRSGLF